MHISLTGRKNSERFLNKLSVVVGLIDAPLEEKKWLVEGLLPKTTVGMLSANKGCGKSNWLTGLAMAISGGGSFQNCQVTKPQKVLLIVGEESKNETHRKLQAHFDYLTEKAEDSEKLDKGVIRNIRKNLKLLFVHGKEAELIREESAYRDFFDELAQVNYGLIIFDPGFRFFHGDDKNYHGTINFISYLEKLTYQHQTSVLFAHHEPLIESNTNQTLLSLDNVYEERLNWICKLFPLSVTEHAKYEISASQTGLLEGQEYQNWIYQDLITKYDALIKENGKCYLKKEQGGVLVKKLPPTIPSPFPRV